jgi:putative membrane protein
MMLVKWVVIAACLVLLANILPGIEVANFPTALVAGLVIGLVNAIIGPVLRFVTFPLTLVTLGLFLFVLNAFLFWLASVLVPGFEVHGFLNALLGSLFLTLVHTLLNWVAPPRAHA